MNQGEIGLHSTGRKTGFATRVKLRVVATLLLAAVSTADAQPVPVNPVPQGSPIPRVLPPAPPSVAPGTVIPPPAAPSAEVPNRPVHVSSVEVEGVTAYPQPEIAQLAAGLVGPAVPLPQIDAARQAILRRYRSDGYVLTTVSANLDANGRLRFVVTEGRIASVKLDGDIGPAGTQVLQFLNRLTEKQPIDSVTLERYLLLAQDVPGVSLRAVLEPSADTPGALNLIAQVSRQQVSGLGSLDNRAFDQTGPIEFLGVLDANSFTEFGEKTELSYYHTFPNSQNFGQVSTEAFIGASGLKGRIYGGYGGTAPTGTLGLQGYNGTTTVFGSSLSYPVIRSRQQTLNVNLVFDALNSNISIAPNGTPREQASYDALRVLRLGADYALSDLWLGADRSASQRVVGALLARPEAFGRLDKRRFRDIPAGGRADRLHQIQLRGEPHSDPVRAVGGRQRRADGACSPGSGRTTSCRQRSSSISAARVSPAATMRARCRATRHWRRRPNCSSTRVSKRQYSTRRSTFPPSITCSTTGARHGRT